MKLFPNIVAHRGGKGPHMENTLPAFQLGIRQGAKAIEMDIRLDHVRKRFYLEHDFFHSPRKNFNLLASVIAAIPKDVHIFVELKTLSCVRSYFVRQFAKAYKEILKDRHITVISFNPIALSHLRRLMPQVEIGYLCGNPLWLWLFKAGLSKTFRPAIFLLHKRLFNLNNVKFGRAQGMKVFGFVFNNENYWQKGLDYGIDGIVTDYPVELEKFIKAKLG
jgi:glycerophosphoryl diester phosphodiesterase